MRLLNECAPVHRGDCAFSQYRIVHLGLRIVWIQNKTGVSEILGIPTREVCVDLWLVLWRIDLGGKRGTGR